MRLIQFILKLSLALITLLPCTLLAAESRNIPILVYHNFSNLPGSMNLTPQKVEAQIKWIKENGYTVIPLKEAVAYLQGKQASIPPKAVVVTADDGWESDYTHLYPIVKKYQIPVTLFIYPETISKGKHALTWEQLQELQQTGLFDVQDHTYSHPNFKHAKRSMSAEKYHQYVTKELVNSKKILEDKLGIKVEYLAWPFGIYDKDLEQAAADAGYAMAFTIDARTANKSFRPEAQPRYMIVEGVSEKTFEGIIKSANRVTNN